ncbi:MAG: Ig-like domain-containing protein [Eubacteriales bacterium]
MKNKIYSKLIPCILVVSALLLPVQGFFWWNDSNSASVEPIHRQVLVKDTLSFSSYDFYGKDGLKSITIQTLPDPQFGTLFMANIPLNENEIIEISALSALKFQAKNVLGSTKFEIMPSFYDGSTGETVIISLEILEVPNEAPLAKDMELFTYKNIEISCYFDTIDSEGDFLTFQITAPPARGAVTLSENGSSSFVYSPYENKTGKDSFQYIATDSSGNVSNEGTVSIRIDKAKVVTTYADMEGNSAHKSAISLAEEGIYVGECIGTSYFFNPEEMVTREEFLSLAMAVAELPPLEEVSLTGFYDDATIPTWAKGYVSSALLAGVIQGSQNENGKPVFGANTIITMGEASVILDNLLQNESSTQVSGSHWASQASANLDAVGVSSQVSLPSGLNRGEVAELLDSALALFKEKQVNWMDW